MFPLFAVAAGLGGLLKGLGHKKQADSQTAVNNFELERQQKNAALRGAIMKGLMTSYKIPGLIDPGTFGQLGQYQAPPKLKGAGIMGLIGDTLGAATTGLATDADLRSKSTHLDQQAGPPASDIFANPGASAAASTFDPSAVMGEDTDWLSKLGTGNG